VIGIIVLYKSYILLKGPRTKEEENTKKMKL